MTIIFILISCLCSVVEMAVLWTVAKMPILVYMLLALSDVIAYTTTGRTSLAPSETTEKISASVYTNDVVNDERSTELFVGEQTGIPEVMLNEHRRVFAELFRAFVRNSLTSDIVRKTPKTVHTGLKNRYNGWFARPRKFRSDLGKRSIRTSSERVGSTAENAQHR